MSMASLCVLKMPAKRASVSVSWVHSGNRNTRKTRGAWVGVERARQEGRKNRGRGKQMKEDLEEQNDSKKGVWIPELDGAHQKVLLLGARAKVVQRHLQSSGHPVCVRRTQPNKHKKQKKRTQAKASTTKEQAHEHTTHTHTHRPKKHENTTSPRQQTGSHHTHGKI